MFPSFKNSGTKSTKETFGSGINEKIVSQLDARAELFSKESKTKEDILALNSNNAWIRVRSGVNYKNSPNLSIANILGGDDKAGINRGIQTNTAYNNSISRGFRPKPGITSFTVDTKNTYGSLRQAEIGLTVWSLEDLENFDKIYFRPGFTILVEWGHSYYIDENLNKYSSPSIIKNNDWFGSAKSITDIEKHIEGLRVKSSFNYDGFFGYIYNFSWNFRQDGGYDCKIKIVSKGILLDSLKVGKTGGAIPGEALSATDKEQTGKKRKSPFHYVFYAIEEKSDEQQFTKKDLTVTSNSLDSLEDFTVFRHGLLIDGEGWFGLAANRDVYYIKLKTFLDIFNKFSSLYNITNGDKLIEFDLRYGEKFVTHNKHFSTDPLVAVPPATPKADEYQNYIIKGKGKNLHDLMELHANEEGGTNDIMNIMVSTKFLQKALEDVTVGPQDSGTGFFDAVKSILSGIQSAFGEINKFNITYTEDTCKHIVVDRDIVAEVGNKSDTPVVNVSGIRSSIEDLSISSKISNQMASQIAIAAQGSPGDYSENVSAILKWNEDVVDRHIKEKSTSTKKVGNEDPNIENQQFENFRRSLTLAWLNFNKIRVSRVDDISLGVTVDATGVFKPEYMENLRQESIALNQKNLTESRANSKYSVGTIPIELQFKFLGVSGIKVGQTFRINKGVLPSRYDDWGYIVTGLNNSIDNNKWYTTVNTQFYKLK